MAKKNKMVVDSKADQSESVEKENMRTADILSKMVGSQVYIDGKYEPWKIDERGNWVRFSRYYPTKKLYIDIFTDKEEENEIDERRNMVVEREKYYLPIRQGQKIKDEDVKRAMR